MRRFALLLFAATLGACASSSSSTTTQGPVPVPPPPAQPAATPPRAPAPRPAGPLTEAPRAWQLLDFTADRVPGPSAERAYRELLAGRAPARTVVVAIIDGGVDTAHVDLRANLWKNEDETPGNGQDDDGNGYVDDVYGWNFLGGRNGESVHHDTYEVTRLHRNCVATEASLAPPERMRCAAIADDFRRERAEADQTLQQIRVIDGMLSSTLPVLRRALGSDSLTEANVRALRPAGSEAQQARSLFLNLAENGLTPKDVADAMAAYSSRVDYGLNPSYNPRSIVGDDYSNLDERVYGNHDVTGPDAGHGTHVAGIIGAVRGNNEGIDGIAPAVRIMSVRTVPDGDEHDKDVANAIRYAVDNGAHIINMSFGKAHSPGKSAVDEAVKYADSRGVLMIHAAGNDGNDNDTEENYPRPVYLDGGRAANWIEVGAASWKVDSLAAPFSNYGATSVDIFAPGMEVLSTKPGNAYEPEDGTSMAAPVVTGVAALLMAFYPDLGAADVRRILLESAVRHDRRVARPGEPPQNVPFTTLSVTGGVVNAFEAVRMAEAMRGGR